MIFDIPHLHSNNSYQIRKYIHDTNLFSIFVSIVVVESQNDVNLPQQRKYIFLGLAEK